MLMNFATFCFMLNFLRMDYTLNVVSKCHFSFVFEHSRAPKMSWKIFPEGPGKSWKSSGFFCRWKSGNPVFPLIAVCCGAVMQDGWSCSEDCHLGYFVYMSFNETDFADFGEVYNYNNRSAGYYKHNLTANAHPQSKTWLTSVVRLYRSKGIAHK